MAIEQSSIGKVTDRLLGRRQQRRAYTAPTGETSLRDEMTALFGTILPLIDERRSVVLHVAAAIPGEGVTTIALGLAAAALRRENCQTLCLEIESEASRSSGARSATALEQLAESGAVQPASRLFDGIAVPFATLVRSTGDGPKPQQLRSLYEWTRQNFALTIVDCPPILGPHNTAALSRIADGTLFVVGADDTRVQVVKRARDTLEAAGATILGVVLNRRQNFIPAPLYRFL
jgi:Mrp family chromosome partitioning ATPase